MEKFLSFFTLCVFALLQGHTTVAQSVNPLPVSPSNFSPDILPEKRPPPPPPFEYDPSNRTDFEIVNLCTEIPFQLNQLLSSYVDAPFTSTSEEAKSISEILKTETNRLREYANEYSKTAVSAADSSANNVAELMSSAIDDLLSSLQQIDTDLDAENSESTDDNGTEAAAVLAERIALIESTVRPAISKFQESCIAQTTNILENVMNQIQEQLMNGARNAQEAAAEGREIAQDNLSDIQEGIARAQETAQDSFSDGQNVLQQGIAEGQRIGEEGLGNIEQGVAEGQRIGERGFRNLQQSVSGGQRIAEEGIGSIQEGVAEGQRIGRQGFRNLQQGGQRRVQDGIKTIEGGIAEGQKVAEDGLSRGAQIVTDSASI